MDILSPSEEMEKHALLNSLHLLVHLSKLKEVPQYGKSLKVKILFLSKNILININFIGGVYASGFVANAYFNFEFGVNIF
jgi:hypothetical protein